MKRVLISILLISACFVYAQESMFYPNTEWHYRVTDICEDTSGFRTFGVSDTIVNNITYQYTHFAFIRTEGAKVWLLVDSMGEWVEKLLYDFDLQVGDSIRTISDDMMRSPYFAKVTRVDTITLTDGRTARRLHYNGRHDDIEHIGNINGFWGAVERVVPPNGIIESFVCCTCGDNLLYEISYGECDQLLNPDTIPHQAHSDTWHTIKFNGMNLEMSGDYELWTYKVGNDTIIDGKTYAPFYGEETTGGAQSFGSYLIRYSEDSTKIYVHITDDMPIINREQMQVYMDGEDMLVYDYAAQAGDSVYTLVYDCQGVHVVTAIVDSVFTKYGRRCVSVTTIMADSVEVDNLQESDTWVEGLGGMAFLPNYVCPGGMKDYILCAMRGDELLYRMDDAYYRQTFYNRYGVPSPCHDVKDAISEILSPVSTSDIPYNILGQPVDDTYHGIVIRNGKKMLQ